MDDGHLVDVGFSLTKDHVQLIDDSSFALLVAGWLAVAALTLLWQGRQNRGRTGLVLA
jgi:hypothetical protein